MTSPPKYTEIYRIDMNRTHRNTDKARMKLIFQQPPSLLPPVTSFLNGSIAVIYQIQIKYKE